MNIEGVLSFAKTLLARSIKPGDIAIDATVGNGHDAVFLAELVGVTGHVYGFDIQKEAIDQSLKHLFENGLQDRVTLHLLGHENVQSILTNPISIGGAIFNLGYLPGGNKEIVTTPKTTISAVQQIYSLLKPGGIIVIVIYHGHEGGAFERDMLLNYVKQIDQQDAHVLCYQFINQGNYPPFIIAIEKRTR